MPNAVQCQEVPDNRWELLLAHETNKGGEYLCFAHKDTPQNLVAVVVCPRCKRPGKCSKHRVVSEKPLSLDPPAFICTQKYKVVGGRELICGYRGILQNGVLTEL